MLALTEGCAAFWDTFVGMVPVKVLTLSGSSRHPVSSIEVTFEVTADTGPYRKGEQLTRSSLWICPRQAFYYNASGQGRIRDYRVGAPEDGPTQV